MTHVTSPPDADQGRAAARVAHPAGPGAVLFGAALLGFAANLVATLAVARERGLTWWCLAGAVVFLVLTVVVEVAHRLFPMFLLSHGASERPERAAAGRNVGERGADTFRFEYLEEGPETWRVIVTRTR